MLVKSLFLLVSLAQAATNALPERGDVKRAVALNFAAQFSKMMNLPENLFQIQLDQLHVEPALPAQGVALRAQVLGIGTLGLRRLDGLFTTPVVLNLSNGQNFEAQVSGLLKVTGPALVARHPLNSGLVVSQNDLNWTQMPWQVLPTGAAGTSVAQILGKRLKAYVPAGQAVSADWVDEPLAVKSGDLVELRVHAGESVLLRSRAIARGQGHIGEAIRVEQPDTKKMLSAEVIDDKVVEVRL